MLATVAMAGLMSGSAARLQAATTGAPDQGASVCKGQLADDTSSGKHDCKGQNTCKGQGGCKTGDASCKGKNTCKGKGGCKTSGAA